MSDVTSSGKRNKHSFDADEATEYFLARLKTIKANRTAFVNRCIQLCGAAVLQSMIEERRKAENDFLREINNHEVKKRVKKK